MEKQAEGLVNDAKVPVTVDYIARQLHIAWDTARSLLLSLAVKERVSAVKTMKSWIFQKRSMELKTIESQEAPTT